jgi:predicted nucleic acid-binding protein
VILVDTSVWIDHLRRGNADLAAALEHDLVVCHPFVIGELACGNLANRAELLALLAKLPTVPVATDTEVLTLIERRRLMGRGLGYVDAHLLASAAIGSVTLWTLDARLAQMA